MQLAGFYSKDGRMLGVARNIHFSSLPLMLQIEQRKNYKAYWITSIYELSNGDGTRYYLTLENADKEIKLGSTGDNWEVVKKQGKAIVSAVIYSAARARKPGFLILGPVPG